MPPVTPELISPRSPRVLAARRLARRNFRGKERLFLAEGPQAVREAAGHGDTLVELFATVESAERYADIVGEARDAGVRIHLAADDVIADISTTVTPQGLVGICRFLDTPFEQILAARPKLVAVLAHVRDPGNAGTVLRCADAAGAEAVVLTDASVDLYNPKAVRASVGSVFHLPASPWRRRSTGSRAPVCGFSPPTAPAATTSTTNSTRAPWAGRRPGCSGTRPGGSRKRPAHSRTPWCAFRSTGRPRA
jgi:TrmH family RNA methyltransferase